MLYIKKPKRRPKFNLIASIAISYIAMIIIPFLCTIYIYRCSTTMLRDTMRDTVSENMNTALVAIENAISSCADFAESIQTSNNISECLSIGNINPDKPDYKLIQLSDFLKSFPNESVKLVYCYFPQIDYCVSNAYTNTPQSFFENYYDDEGFTYEQWKKRLTSFAYSNYIITKDSGGQKCIDFFYTSPLKDINSTLQYTCVIRLRSDVLLSLIKQYMSLEDCNTYIIDKNNNILLQSIVFDEYDAPVYESGQNVDRSETDRVLTITKNFSINSWQMIVSIPHKVLDNQLYYIKTVLVIIVILCIVFTTILAGYFTQKNYMPLKKILNIVSEENIFSRNEFSMINEALNHLQNKMMRFNQISSNNELIKRDQFLSCLLTGQTEQYGSVENSLSKFDITFNSEYFAVAIFRIVDADMLFADDPGENFDNYKRAETITFIMRNVLEEIISENHKAYLIDFNGLHTAIININPEMLQSWQTDIKKSLEDAKAFIQDNFNFSYIAGISNLYNGISRLNHAFGEAEKTFIYRTSVKNNDIMLYRDFNNENKGLFFAKTNELVSFIKMGNYKVAKKIAEDIFERLDSGNTEAAGFLSLRIMSSVTAALIQRNMMTDTESCKSLFRYMDNTLDEDALNRLCDFIKTACNICAETEQISENDASGSEKTDIISEIKEYVQANYRNPELNVAAVGYYFDITPYYISSLFKKSEGISILDYISITRINAAVELLHTDMSIANIAEAVGFGNVRTFVRVFKNQRGCPPKQFREKM